MSTYEVRTICRNCGKRMNIATGTFGYGIPKDCPNCKKELEYEVISDGWHADETSLTNPNAVSNSDKRKTPR